MGNVEHRMERIILNREMVEEIEQDMLIRRHIERYALVRQYLFGKVLDAACGVGYGSYLMAKNPDVVKVLGIDCDAYSIEYANKNFTTEKVSFCCDYFDNINDEYDILISLETIEHLENPKQLASLALRCNVKEVIVSYPIKKTTHYNKFHYWDFTEYDIKYIFNKYECINEIKNGDSNIMHFIKRNQVASKAKRYLHNIK